MTTFYSPEAAELRVGPGVGANLNDDDVIRFQLGYVEIDPKDPRYDEKLGWIAHARRSFPIEQLDDNSGQVPAVLPGANVCEICAATGVERAFATANALRMHKLSHRPKKG